MINQITVGHCLDVLKRIPDKSVHCCVTSPPYWGLRDYLLEPVYWPAVSYSPMPGLPEICIPEGRANLGLESDLWAFVGHMVAIFREVYRILRPDGTLWLNLGDTYITSPPGNNGKHNNLGDGAYKRQQDRQLSHGEDMKAIYQKPKELKMKDLAGIPWRIAYALQADRWYLRSDVIWHKPNPMPESVTDRPAKAHEYVFLLSKSERYFYDAEAIKEPTVRPGDVQTFGGEKARAGQINGGDPRNGHRTDDNSQWGKDYETKEARNRRTVWTVATQPYAAAHFATFPPKLIEPMILASTSEYGVCGECGAQWVREVEKKVNLESGRRQVGLGPKTLDNPMTKNGQQGSTLHHTVEKTTTGWRPPCSCNAPTVPAIVLDPFMGSGTTAKVALANRRNYIGIDANPTYAEELAPERLNGTQIKLV
jgi:DNA modification methylase